MVGRFARASAMEYRVAMSLMYISMYIQDKCRDCPPTHSRPRPPTLTSPHRRLLFGGHRRGSRRVRCLTRPLPAAKSAPQDGGCEHGAGTGEQHPAGYLPRVHAWPVPPHRLRDRKQCICRDGHRSRKKPRVAVHDARPTQNAPRARRRRQGWRRARQQPPTRAPYRHTRRDHVPRQTSGTAQD